MELSRRFYLEFLTPILQRKVQKKEPVWAYPLFTASSSHMEAPSRYTVKSVKEQCFMSSSQGLMGPKIEQKPEPFSVSLSELNKSW